MAGEGSLKLVGEGLIQLLPLIKSLDKKGAASWIVRLRDHSTLFDPTAPAP
jgi:hypothetical protein